MYNRDHSDTILNNCHFIQNTAATDSGGMYNWIYSNLSLNNCTFSGNSAPRGGGMYNRDYSDPTLNQCVFNDNTVTIDGGGIFNRVYSSPVLTGCLFSGNSAQFGGAIYNLDYSAPLILKCHLENNTALEDGGVMFNWANGNPTLINCIIEGNIADSDHDDNGDGGGIYNREDSNPVLTNCTFAGNEAVNGKALACDDPYSHLIPSTSQITNCILWDGGDEIWNNDSSTITVTYSDIQQTSGSYPGAGNINATPLFVNPAVSDYHLQVGSPCIDTGTNSGAPPDDIVGSTRPADGDGNGTATTDMGAYEYATPHSPGTIICTVGGQLISLTVTDGSVAYGSVDFGGTRSTLELLPVATQTVTNTGSVAERIMMKCSDATNGATWVLVPSSDTERPDEFAHQWSTNGGGVWNDFNPGHSYGMMVPSLAPSNTQNFDLKIHMPTTITDMLPKSITITVMATVP